MSFPPDRQILLLLVGLVGSGKTTLAESFVKEYNGHSDDSTSSSWVRASQDDIPGHSRRNCEAMIRQALTMGSNVIVDRMNFNLDKYTVPGKSLITFFDVPSIQTKTRYLHLTQVLKARLDQRTTHPTIATPQDARRVLNQVSPSYRPPHPSIPEGFARAYVLPFNQQPVVTASTTTTTTHLSDESPVRWPREALDRIMNDLQSSPAAWSDEGKPVVWFQDRQPAPQHQASQPADQLIDPQGNPGLGRHEMGGPWPGRGRPGGSFPGRGRGRGQGLDTVQGGREWGPPNASHGFRERADRPPPPPAPPSS